MNKRLALFFISFFFTVSVFAVNNIFTSGGYVLSWDDLQMELQCSPCRIE